MHEAAVSREKGIAVPADRDAEAARIATAMLRTAIGAHLGTAAVAVLAAWATGRAAGYWLAGCSLLSTLFRPAGAYFGALLHRLRVLSTEVRHPRDDVVEVRTAIDAVGLSAHERADRTDRRVELMGREFESVVDRLTDNREIISGLHAFLRLLRSDPAGT
ncbi:hypothetical protein AB0J38_34715 [Streptomyces sp. NPDC050095]|uniref:hypothetical protein n=1 Tax=unclassified Streptomyces TaxID=2593676 RepID=UPI0034126AF4